MLGRVMSLHAISTRGIAPLGYFQMGTLTTFVGVQHAVAIGGLLSCLATIAVAIAIPEVRTFSGDGTRRRPHDDAPEVELSPHGQPAAAAESSG
jgi:hypothetical protein